jgi:hypothetical protein
VYDLVAKGFVRKHSKKGNSTLYGLADKSMYSESEGMEEVPIIPFGGNLLKVSDFLETMVSQDEDPLNANPNLKLLRHAIATGIRRAMTGVVMTSGVAGQEQFLLDSRTQLQAVEDELRFLLKVISHFNDSGVWFDQYRDRIAFQTRRAQQTDHELWQLAMDFVRSGTG